MQDNAVMLDLIIDREIECRPTGIVDRAELQLVAAMPELLQYILRHIMAAAERYQTA